MLGTFQVKDPSEFQMKEIVFKRWRVLFLETMSEMLDQAMPKAYYPWNVSCASLN